MTAPHPILEEMPYPVMSQIFGCLETNDKLALRLTSSTLKSVVECSTFLLNRCYLKLDENSVEIQINHYNRLYSQEDLQTVVEIQHKWWTASEIRTDSGMRYYDHALKDLKEVLDVFQHLEIKLLKLEVCGNTEISNEDSFLHKFQLVIGKLKVKKFESDLDIQNSSITFMMLDKLTPGKLEFLNVSGCGFVGNSEVQQLLEHPVFRQLKRFRQKAIMPRGTLLSEFLHLEELKIKVSELTVEDVRMLMNEYKKVKHGIFEIKCSSFNQNELFEELWRENPEAEVDEDGLELNFRSDNGAYNIFLYIMFNEISIGTY